jgi:hypothetical protein
MEDTAINQQRFCGREFTTEEVSLIQEVVTTCAGISRLELANTYENCWTGSAPLAGSRHGSAGTCWSDWRARGF